MSTTERRSAALANQRAAAFIRFQMLGDHEAMHYLLTEADRQPSDRLAFVTALASIASTVATAHRGRPGALDYLKLVAESSAVLAGSDDIDGFFDAPGSGPQNPETD